MNNMLLYVSTFKMSSSGSSLCLAKITYRISDLSKIKLLKYIDTGQARPHQQRLHVQPLHKPCITLYSQNFIEVYRFIF